MSGTLTKADIINTIQRENGYSRTKATEMVESLLGLIKTTLESGEDVLRFGIWQILRSIQERATWQESGYR